MDMSVLVGKMDTLQETCVCMQMQVSNLRSINDVKFENFEAKVENKLDRMEETNTWAVADSGDTWSKTAKSELPSHEEQQRVMLSPVKSGTFSCSRLYSEAAKDQQSSWAKVQNKSKKSTSKSTSIFGKRNAK
jgi:hypothetical protein